MSALFVLLGGIIVLLQRAETPYTSLGVGALAPLHGIFIAIIAGSRASAEGRHIATLATQALQPKAAWANLDGEGDDDARSGAREIFFVNSGDTTPAGSTQHAVDMLMHGKRTS